METVVVLLGCGLVIFGCVAIMVVMNRKMIGAFDVYAEAFGLEVTSTRSMGLEKWPRAHGTHRGRSLLFAFEMVDAVRGRKAPAFMIRISGDPRHVVVLNRRERLTADVVFEDVFGVVGQVAVAEALSNESRQVIVARAAEFAGVTEEGIYAVAKVPTLVRPSHAEDFIALTRALYELLEHAERP